MDLLALAKAELNRSNADRKHPFRYFYMATLDEYPEVRMVVKRNFAPDWSVLFYTDSRTPKVKQIRNNELVSALFYHPKKQLQIRMKGRAFFIDETHDDYDRHLQEVKQSPAQTDYMTAKPPGSEIGSEAQIEMGESLYFLAIKIRPEYLDILQLGKEQHTRKAYTLEDGDWKVSVLVP